MLSNGLRKAMGTVNDTARERVEAERAPLPIAKRCFSAVATAPPMSSPSLDWWLQNRQVVIIASAAAEHYDECGDSWLPPPPHVRPCSPPLISEAMTSRTLFFFFSRTRLRVSH